MSACAALHLPASGAASTAAVTETPIPMPVGAQLDAVNADVVWVLIYDRLFRSVDQGEHWEGRPLPPVHDAMVSFVDGEKGWLLERGMPATQCDTSSSWIWRTSDAGATWSRVATQGIAEQQCKENLWFVSDTIGFLTAWDDNHRPTVYRTSDGGLTWSGSVVPDPPGFTTQAGGFTLRVDWIKVFAKTLYLEAWGQDVQYVYRSTDAGTTWSWMTKIPSRYIAMVTESRWLQLVVPGQSMETTTSGQQWHPYDSDFNTDTPVGGPEMVFADPQVGYAEGRGSLQRTNDGGTHWSRIQTPGVQP
ncbi:MAG TPA: hypothetical protein VFK22_00740 [Candidatus Dormibacteraeota bacterium]|nr:hypothetical protein [Candidatus Dormibacteraeota bacterium]